MSASFCKVVWSATKGCGEIENEENEPSQSNRNTYPRKVSHKQILLYIINTKSLKSYIKLIQEFANARSIAGQVAGYGHCGVPDGEMRSREERTVGGKRRARIFL